MCTEYKEGWQRVALGRGHQDAPRAIDAASRSIAPTLFIALPAIARVHSIASTQMLFFFLHLFCLRFFFSFFFNLTMFIGDIVCFNGLRSFANTHRAISLDRKLEYLFFYLSWSVVFTLFSELFTLPIEEGYFLF